MFSFITNAVDRNLNSWSGARHPIGPWQPRDGMGSPRCGALNSVVGSPQSWETLPRVFQESVYLRIARQEPARCAAKTQGIWCTGTPARPATGKARLCHARSLSTPSAECAAIVSRPAANPAGTFLIFLVFLSSTFPASHELRRNVSADEYTLQIGQLFPRQNVGPPACLRRGPLCRRAHRPATGIR